MSVVTQIQHYQRSIDKCSDNESRVLHCIEKLYRLPVTVQHLQETGVGRTVNALRKYEGTVGDAAKALVAKWKSMVVDEEKSSEDEDESCVPDAHEGYSDHSDSPADKERDTQSSSRSREDRHSRNDTSRHKGSSSDNSKSKSSVTKAVPESSTDRGKSVKSSENGSNYETKSEKKSSKTSTKATKSDRHSSNRRHSLERTKKESSEKVSSTTEFLKENGHDASRKRKHENTDRTDKRQRIPTIEESNDDDDDDDEDDNDNDGDDDDDDNDKFLPDTSLLSPEDSKPLESTDSPSDRASTSKESSKREKSSKDKPREEKHKHSSDKHKSRSDKEHKRSDKKDEKSKDSSKSSHHSSKSPNTPKDDSSKHRKSSESKDKHKHREHKEKKNKKKYNGHEGIDCNSGASFAEALGMCTGPSARKKALSSPVMSVTKSTPIIPVTKTKAPETSTSTSSKSIKIKTESSPKDEALSLLAPNVKLEPLSVDLAATLPEISANYKPLPSNYTNPLHRKQEENKALNDVIYAKNMRTKVYSGNKAGYTTVPSLYELCIRVLIENIDALEATGGVPYFIIKPVLERANADQLFMIEHHNPYLVEDTDELWRFHATKEFRNRQREEMESWREMYLRCLDEREAKLKTLTASIEESKKKSLPVRVAKLAYIDNVVKPPRQVIRKQNKYGTGNTATSSSDIKKRILTSGNNAATNISVPAPPLGRIRPSSSGIMKKNKAPLMAKALQLIKGRYKR